MDRANIIQPQSCKGCFLKDNVSFTFYLSSFFGPI
jgi:hypothetical protein